MKALPKRAKAASVLFILAAISMAVAAASNEFEFLSIPGIIPFFAAFPFLWAFQGVLMFGNGDRDATFLATGLLGAVSVAGAIYSTYYHSLLDTQTLVASVLSIILAVGSVSIFPWAETALESVRRRRIPQLESLWESAQWLRYSICAHLAPNHVLRTEIEEYVTKIDQDLQIAKLSQKQTTESSGNYKQAWDIGTRTDSHTTSLTKYVGRLRQYLEQEIEQLLMSVTAVGDKDAAVVREILMQEFILPHAATKSIQLDQTDHRDRREYA